MLALVTILVDALNPRQSWDFALSTKKASAVALALSSGETGTRTQATVSRRQISNLLRYHSGTSPKNPPAEAVRLRPAGGQK